MPLTMMYLCHNLWLFDDIYFHGSNATTSKYNLNKLRNHIGISSMKPNLNSVWGLRDVPFWIYLLRASKCKYIYIHMFIMDLIWGIKSSSFSLTKPFPDKTTWQGGCRMTKQLGWLICSFAKNATTFVGKKINPLFHGCVSCTIDVKSFLLCHKQKPETPHILS